MITAEMKLQMLKTRRAKIAARPDAFKTPGVIRRLDREIRNLEKTM